MISFAHIEELSTEASFAEDYKIAFRFYVINARTHRIFPVKTLTREERYVPTAAAKIFRFWRNEL